MLRVLGEHRLRQPLGGLPALGSRAQAQHRGVRERVVEPAPAGLGCDDQLGRGSLLRRIVELGPAGFQSRLHRREREAVAIDRCGEQQLSSQAAEPGEPGCDQLQHARRRRLSWAGWQPPPPAVPPELAPVDEVVKQFLDQQRIAGTVLPGQLDQVIRGPRGGKARRDQEPGVLAIQRPNRQQLRDATELGRDQHLPGVARLLAQRTQQRHRRFGEMVEQVVQHRQRLRVGVLQILQHQQATGRRGDHRQHPQHRLGQGHRRHRLADAELAGPGYLRHYPAQQRPVTAQVVFGQQAAAVQRGQRLGERAQR